MDIFRKQQTHNVKYKDFLLFFVTLITLGEKN